MNNVSGLNSFICFVNNSEQKKGHWDTMICQGGGGGESMFFRDKIINCASSSTCTRDEDHLNSFNPQM